MSKLEKIRALIEDPSTWTQDAWARNACGREVDFDSPKAVSFCLIGAIRRVTAEDKTEGDYFLEYLTAALDIRGYRAADSYSRLQVFNDTTTHADVIEVLDEALALKRELALGQLRPYVATQALLRRP